MKLPRRQFLHLASGRCRAAGRIAHRVGASLSDAAGADHRWLSRRRRDRHHRASDGSMAVGAARPAIHHREPTRRWQQYRHRSGRAMRPPTAIRSFWSTSANAINATLYDEAQVSISSAILRRSLASPACHSSWWSIHRFRQDRPRVHRLCQGQSGRKARLGRRSPDQRDFMASALFKIMTGLNRRWRAPSDAARHCRLAGGKGPNHFAGSVR